MDQVPGLLRVLQVAELRTMIVNLLVPSIGDLTALSLTCKRAAVCMKDSFVRPFPFPMLAFDPQS